MAGKERRGLAAYVLNERWQIEGEAWCKRRVVERCLFGVDLNPTAVQLAQVALWIESLAGDRPLSFFAHHVRCGNSLIGTWMHRLQLNPLTGAKELEGKQQTSLFEQAFNVTQGLFEKRIVELIKQAMDERLLISQELPNEIRKDSPEEYRYKADRLKASEEILNRVKLIFDLRSASAFLPDIWGEFSTLLGSEELEDYCSKRPWWRQFLKIRERERFFHWELEYPEIFLGETKGFDVVLGNPPWDKLLPSKYEFYGHLDPLIRTYTSHELNRRIAALHKTDPELVVDYAAYEARIKTIIGLFRNGGDFPLSKGRTAAAHEDLSKYFSERALQVLRKEGTLGFLLPSVVYNGDGCASLRKHLISELSIRELFGFENRDKIFAIDSRFKFFCLLVDKSLPRGDSFPVVFMRRHLADLSSAPALPRILMYRAEIETLSPDSFAFLEYQDERDREIIKRMYENGVRLDSSLENGWAAEFLTDFGHRFIYNGTRDKDLWLDPSSGRPYAVTDFSKNDLTWDQCIELMRSNELLPVFQGKHIEQHAFGTKPIDFWLSRVQAKSKYGREPLNESVLVFRRIGRNTDQRTCIATVLPPYSAATDTLRGILLSRISPEHAASVLNSITFDFALRLRVAGTDISFTYIKQMPVPGVRAMSAIPPMKSLPAWSGGLTYITEAENLWQQLWEIERRTAEAYGITPDLFAHMLSRFAALSKRRPAWFNFLKQKTEQWRQETG